MDVFIGKKGGDGVIFFVREMRNNADISVTPCMQPTQDAAVVRCTLCDEEMSSDATTVKHHLTSLGHRKEAAPMRVLSPTGVSRYDWRAARDAHDEIEARVNRMMQLNIPAPVHLHLGLAIGLGSGLVLFMIFPVVVYVMCKRKRGPVERPPAVIERPAVIEPPADLEEPFLGKEMVARPPPRPLMAAAVPAHPSFPRRKFPPAPAPNMRTFRGLDDL